MKHVFWIITNFYGKIFGHAILAPLHHAMVTTSLHALGYGNMYKDSWTGEEWFLKNIVSKSKPRLVFDVGANVGNYSLLLLKYTDATVHAFEPNPSAFEKLQALPESVQKNKLAIGDQNGTAELNFKFDCDGMASLDARVRSGNSVTVSVTSISDYCTEKNIEHIDYLKIDTEGYEREVLVGLGKIRPTYIQFEFNINHLIRGSTVYDLSELLPEYTLYRLLPNGWLKVDPKSYIHNIFIFSNFVAVRNDKKLP